MPLVRKIGPRKGMLLLCWTKAFRDDLGSGSFRFVSRGSLGSVAFPSFSRKQGRHTWRYRNRRTAGSRRRRHKKLTGEGGKFRRNIPKKRISTNHTLRKRNQPRGGQHNQRRTSVN